VKPQHSLRRLLLLWLLPSVLVMLGLSMLGDYMLAIRPATHAYDQSLQDAALVLVDHLRQAPDGSIILPLSPEAERVLRTQEFDHIYYAAYMEGGQLLAGTAGLLPPDAGSRVSTNKRFYNVQWRGQSLRLMLLHTRFANHPVIIQVAETTTKRHQLSRQIILGMFLPELLTVTSVMIAVWIGVGRGLAPLERLQKLVAERNRPSTLQLPEAQAPKELFGLVHMHNVQSEKLAETLELQEHFITNAAHQLRTPLAGLQAQSELALKLVDKPGTQQDLRRIIININTAAMRSSRLVQQLLGLARSTTSAGAFHDCDLTAVAENVANRFMDRAVDANIDLGLELEQAVVPGIAMLLEEMLGNLLDNALHYCPHGSSITISSRLLGSRAVLAIEDNGPGIPEAEHERVFERFYRLSDTKQGAGLGLAIVHEIAALHGAGITLGNGAGGRGLRVEISFRAGPAQTGTEEATAT
jgi:two-component system sensor histidine kinase TctE